jgi:hypothetical protein
MGEKMFRKIAIGLLLLLSCVGYCQTEEEQDLMFSVGVLSVQMQRLLGGDLTDKSDVFPKTKSGLLLQSVYRSVLRQVVRDTFVARKILEAEYVELVSGAYNSSPKAGLKIVAKITHTFSVAKHAYVKDLKLMKDLLDFKDDDSSAMRSFKEGAKTGFLQSQQQLGGKDPYTLNLIYLSKWEDALHFLDQHRDADFSDPKLQDAWIQKQDAIDKASKALDDYDAMRDQRLKRFKEQGIGSSSG